MSPSGDVVLGQQSHRMSLVEAIANVCIGYGVAVLTQVAVFPLFGIDANLQDNLAIGGAFTIVSIARSYILRRVFEAIRMRQRFQTAGGDSDRLTTRKGMRNRMRANVRLRR